MQLTRANVLVLGVLLLLVLVVGWFAWSALSESREEELARSPAGTALTQNAYTTVEGEAVDLSEYVGTVTVAAAWASWCPQCREQLSELSQLADAYENRINVIAINRAESRTTAERYLAQVDTTDSLELILDPADAYYASIEGYAMPETIVYDEAGAVVYHGRGSIDMTRIRAAVEAALQPSE